MKGNEENTSLLLSNYFLSVTNTHYMCIYIYGVYNLVENIGGKHPSTFRPTALSFYPFFLIKTEK